MVKWLVLVQVSRSPDRGTFLLKYVVQHDK